MTNAMQVMKFMSTVCTAYYVQFTSNKGGHNVTSHYVQPTCDRGERCLITGID
jgi:hypothetical protein